MLGFCAKKEFLILSENYTKKMLSNFEKPQFAKLLTAKWVTLYKCKLHHLMITFFIMAQLLFFHTNFSHERQSEGIERYFSKYPS